MAKKIVGISEMAWSDDPEDTLVTHSLGSCLGIVFYDPVQKIGGMLHCMLPLSKTDRQRSKRNPAMFVDTGVTALLTEILKAGSRKKDIITRVAGGACVLDRQDLFRIGERNYTVFRKVLWKNSMLIDAEDVGGSISRTVRLEIATGRMIIRTGSEEKEL
jgi:chemotaxis protein CheD